MSLAEQQLRSRREDQDRKSNVGTVRYTLIYSSQRGFTLTIVPVAIK